MRKNKNKLYSYDAYVYNVVDGDTFDCFVILEDYGFRRYEMTIERFRLLGCNAWEVRGPEREKGLLAKTRVEELILHKWVPIETKKKPGKYGRWLAEVLVPELAKERERNRLHEILIDEGHARE